MQHEMRAADALAIMDVLDDAGVDACLSGGWSVDALVGRRTRAHADLDLWLPATSFDVAEPAFVELGIDRLYPWGDDRPWNFVLHDGERRRVDLHLYEPLSDGELFHYGGVESGETFPCEALGGRGVIDGRPVRCESPEWCLRFHLGYPPRPVDLTDVNALCRTFGWDVPDGYRIGAT